MRQSTYPSPQISRDNFIGLVHAGSTDLNGRRATARVTDYDGKAGVRTGTLRVKGRDVTLVTPAGDLLLVSDTYNNFYLHGLDTVQVGHRA